MEKKYNKCISAGLMHVTASYHGISRPSPNLGNKHRMDDHTHIAAKSHCTPTKNVPDIHFQKFLITAVGDKTEPKFTKIA